MRTKQTTLLLVALAVLSLTVSAGLNRQLYRLRADGSGVPELQGGTPLVTFATVVLGGFRGIIADVLWLRATYLQDEGRFFELAQLSEWITQLEAHSAEIWAFHAWNMAYNISALMGEDDERWRWVTQGLDLLRDRAIRINPSEASLYAELAWIYQQKIGGMLDNAHVYYKQRWARAMSRALPPGGFLSDARNEGATLDTQKRELLQQRWNLAVEQMAVIDERFGPLDWRVAEAHAVYWSYTGRGRRGLAAQLRCERTLYQSMGTLFFRGRLPATLPATGFPCRARPDLFAKSCDAFEVAAARYPDDENIRTAYRVFLQSAVLLLDACRDEAQARTALARLHTLDASAPSGTVAAFVESADLRQLPGTTRAAILQERRFSEARALREKTDG